MAASGSFTCPACGAEFDVQQRLDGLRDAKGVAPAAAPEPVNFQCPGCGADYEAQEELEPEPARSESIR